MKARRNRGRGQLRQGNQGKSQTGRGKHTEYDIKRAKWEGIGKNRAMW